MAGAAAHLIPYALVATLSPLGFAATLAVMRTGRLKALGFGLGVVFGQLIACAALVAIGAATTPHRTKAYPTFEGLLQVALGIALLCFAIVVYRRPDTGRRSASGRSQAALDRLQRVHVMTASAIGLLLGIGGPKRLLLTGLASASIAATGMTGSNEFVLVVWYTLLATALVWFPVLAYLLFGDWAVIRLDAALKWLGRHRRPLMAYAIAVLGGVLLVDGLLLL
ncbi:MAG: GAP family protein [Gaiellaceae bacterium]